MLLASKPEIFYCAQGTDEWHALRAGIVTASEFDAVQATGKGGAPSKTRRTYMLKLIGERLTGEPAEHYSNKHMERGHELEPVARRLYAIRSGAELTQVGFIRRGEIGCSPDSLIDSEGMLEVKTKLPHLQLEVLLANRFPIEHKAQVQGQLMVADRAWCDFVSYWPGLPLFVIRVERDEPYIKALAAECEAFVEEMRELTARITQPQLAEAA